jgi:hypothetical protein
MVTKPIISVTLEAEVGEYGSRLVWAKAQRRPYLTNKQNQKRLGHGSSGRALI